MAPMLNAIPGPTIGVTGVGQRGAGAGFKRSSNLGCELTAIGAAVITGIARVERKETLIVPTLYSFESSPIYYLLIGLSHFS